MHGGRDDEDQGGLRDSVAFPQNQPTTLMKNDGDGGGGDDGDGNGNCMSSSL